MIDINAVDTSGATALNLAKSKNSDAGNKVVKYLESESTEPEGETEDGCIMC